MKVAEMFDLSHEVAVVIGGTGVLGGTLAGSLAEAGARVAVVGRNAERGQGRVRDIDAKRGKGLFVSADATQRESLRSAREQIQKAFGVPTILVNAAGGNDPKVTITAEHPFEQVTLTDWEANFRLNVAGGILLPCQEFGPVMVNQGRGSIINIASVAAHVPLSRVGSYSAAKAAVISLTRFLAREWAGKGVRVNSVTPGFFPAEQNRRLLFNEDGSPTPRASAILGHTPMARFGRAEELAGAVIFLASDKASGFVTGADIRVDGGFLCQTI